MASQGVNLGGWLVTERWITPSLYEGTRAQDEYSLLSKNPEARQRLAEHQATFITRSDISWLAAKGVTDLRVPVGYWLFKDQPPFIANFRHLDNLFLWAKEFNLKVRLSIHAAPGSQNGKLHSGKIGPVGWRKQPAKLLRFASQLTDRYSKEPSFAGVGLLNEPKMTPVNIWFLIKYYRQVRRLYPNIKFYIDGSFACRWFWALVAYRLGVGLDVHLYHGRLANLFLARVRLKYSQFYLGLVSKFLPVIVGEWSGMVHLKPARAAVQDYIKDQRQSYQSAEAEYYWTYKVERGTTWSFRNSHKK